MAKQELLQWYEIVTPDVFGGKVIGQTTANQPEKLIGRVIGISLMELSGEATRYYIKLFFKTKNLIGSKLTTTFFGHDCTKDFVARIVQVRTDRIDTNTTLNLKDAKLQIKSIAITNRCIKKGTERDLRKVMNEAIKTELEKITLEDFAKSLVTGVLQKKIRKEISVIYPLRQFEFRKSQIL